MPGSEHMLKTVNLSGSQPNTIAPATRIRMAKLVLNTVIDSTGGTKVTPQRLDSFVVESVTARFGCQLQSSPENLESEPVRLGLSGS